MIVGSEFLFRVKFTNFPLQVEQIHIKYLLHMKYRSSKMKFDLKFLNECFDVDFIVGEIRWKSTRPINHFSNIRGYINWHNKNPGKVAGHTDANGYRSLKLTVKGKEYNLKYHRILYALFHEDCDPPLIDHFDGNPLNNSISNLRPANHNINARNRIKSVRNKSGITGVRRRKDRDLWIAYIIVDGKTVTKTTTDFFEACCFRKSWESRLKYTARHGKTN